MNKISYAALGAAALAIAATPVAAEATRASAPVTGENRLDGPTLTAILVVAALIAGVVIFADGDDEPVSA